MYILQKLPKDVIEHFGTNYVYNIKHQLRYDEDSDKIVVVTIFSYFFNPFGGTCSVQDHPEGICYKELIDNDNRVIASIPESQFNQKYNQEYWNLVDQTSEYYDLSQHIQDSANQFIAKESYKLLQSRIDLLNIKDFNLLQDVQSYMDKHSLTTLSATFRHMLNYSTKLYNKGIRIDESGTVSRLIPIK